MGARSGVRRSALSASRRDVGHRLAQFLCLVFALAGLVPVALAILVRTEAASEYVSQRAEALLREKLGVEAEFVPDVRLIPLSVGVRDLIVYSQDGGRPALQVDSLFVRPRMFSLLSGKLDLGDIEVESPVIRAVIREGKLTNLKLPEGGDSERPDRSPFRSLMISGAKLDLTVDNDKVNVESLDLDTFAEGLQFDIALRANDILIETRPDGQLYRDKVCAIDFRAHVSESWVRLPRLSILAGLSPRPGEGQEPSCDGGTEDRVALRLSGIHLALDHGSFKSVAGRVFFVAPGRLAERLASLPKTTGWVGYSGEVSYKMGDKLPTMSGQLSGAHLRIGEIGVSEKLSAKVLLRNGEILVPRLEAGWANGTAVIKNARLAPFEKGGPLQVEQIDVSDMNFPGVMRDVAITRNTIVDWNYDKVSIERVRGGLSPFFLDGGIHAETSNFAVYNKAYHAPDKQRMVGVGPAKIDTRFRANETALEFYDALVAFGSSKILAKLVSIGFSNAFALSVQEGSEIELGDIGPLGGIATEGRLKLAVTSKGPMNHPTIEGQIGISDFMLGGFDAGNIERADVSFEPLHVDFKNVLGAKEDMPFSLPHASLVFDGDATVEFRSQLSSPDFQVRRFMEIFHFDNDPRFSELDARGRVRGSVRYVLGGPYDECKTGRLFVDGDADLGKTRLFGEQFQAASGRFQLDWFDMDATTRGMDLTIPSFRLAKGAGAIYGDIQVRRGGALGGAVILSRIPVSEFELTSPVLGTSEGYLSGTANLSGTLEALAFESRMSVTELAAGDAKLGPSRLSVALIPRPHSEPAGQRSACGIALGTEFDRKRYDEDRADGDFHLSGELFSGKIKLRDVQITAQRARHIRGSIELSHLPIADLLQLAGAGDAAPGLEGVLSGGLQMEDIQVSALARSTWEAKVTQLDLSRGALGVTLPGAPLVITEADEKITLTPALLKLRTKSGGSATLAARGQINSRGEVEADLKLAEGALGTFLTAVPGVSSAEGKLSAEVTLRGKFPSPRLSGEVRVESGKVLLSALPTPITNLRGRLVMTSEEIRFVETNAEMGGGHLTLSGGAELNNLSLGDLELALFAKDVALPLGSDTRVTLDSELRLAIPAKEDQLPKLTGDVLLSRAEYERKMAISADLADIAARGKKTEVSLYDPEKDKLAIDLVVRAARPVKVKNSLVEAEMTLDDAGVHILGTDQRFGALGNVTILPGGKVRLRRNVFDIKTGAVKFTDATRITPEVDVSALTEFRRSQDRSQPTNTLQPASTSAAAGNWRITMRAYGSPDDLHVDLKSDPPLGSDDIFLLLTVGMTRTELDQSRSAGVGSSVALEALGSLSGAESVVTDTVPVDEFRFGSLYSAKSGRSEPTVTIGKRLSDRIRASVTSTMSDTSEVRSNLEYQATEGLSLEGSYDNAQRAGAPTIGNLGGNIRWRLEFE